MNGRGQSYDYKQVDRGMAAKYLKEHPSLTANSKVSPDALVEAIYQGKKLIANKPSERWASRPRSWSTSA